MPHAMWRTSGRRTTIDVASCANGCAYDVTDFSHASGPSNAERLFHTWTNVQTLSGSTARSEPRRARTKLECPARRADFRRRHGHDLGPCPSAYKQDRSATVRRMSLVALAIAFLPLHAAVRGGEIANVEIATSAGSQSVAFAALSRTKLEPGPVTLKASAPGASAAIEIPHCGRRGAVTVDGTRYAPPPGPFVVRVAPRSGAARDRDRAHGERIRKARGVRRSDPRGHGRRRARWSRDARFREPRDGRRTRRDLRAARARRDEAGGAPRRRSSVERRSLDLRGVLGAPRGGARERRRARHAERPRQLALHGRCPSTR